jgi:hypothetical protein
MSWPRLENSEPHRCTRLGSRDPSKKRGGRAQWPGLASRGGGYVRSGAGSLGSPDSWSQPLRWRSNRPCVESGQQGTWVTKHDRRQAKRRPCLRLPSPDRDGPNHDRVQHLLQRPLQLTVEITHLNGKTRSSGEVPAPGLTATQLVSELHQSQPQRPWAKDHHREP